MYTVYMCGGGGANVTAIVVNITDTRDTVVGVRGVWGRGKGGGGEGVFIQHWI